MTIPLVIGVNPLQTTLFELGIVSGREVLLLRSAEIQPVFVRFVPNCFGSSPLPSPWLSQLQGGLARVRMCTSAMPLPARKKFLLGRSTKGKTHTCGGGFFKYLGM
jgi:hypothetical protein